MTWLFVDKHPTLIQKSKEVDFSHLLLDPVVRFQSALDPYFRHFMCFGLLTLYGHYVYKDWKIGLFAFGFLRWIFTLQCTWTVNSLAHYTGTREFNKDIKPANNWLVSILTIGEGWHNYHHTYPYDYSCAEKSALVQYNPSTVLIDLMALLGMVYDRKITKDKSNKITQSIISDMLPFIGRSDSYKVNLKDHRALRMWLFETKDKIEGYNKISQYKLIDIEGDVDEFMNDLVLSSKKPIPLITKTKNMFRLYNMDRIRLADKAG
jgi:stearoyl-CoA desaturase (delta-9 desaturase)